jgi:hypothetical protein
MDRQSQSVEDLARRCEEARAPDRDLDAEIAEVVYGWKRALVGPDCDGQNASEILTEDGKLIKGFAYPPRGKIPLYYHVPQYTRDPRDSLVPRDFIRKQTAQTLRDIAKGRALRTRASHQQERDRD